MATVSLTQRERRMLRTSLVAFLRENPEAVVALRAISGLIGENGGIELTRLQARKLIALLTPESDLDSLVAMAEASRRAVESLRTKLSAV